VISTVPVGGTAKKRVSPLGSRISKVRAVQVGKVFIVVLLPGERAKAVPKPGNRISRT
jgi:hypothetical protein